MASAFAAPFTVVRVERHTVELHGDEASSLVLGSLLAVFDPEKPQEAFAYLRVESIDHNSVRAQIYSLVSSGQIQAGDLVQSFSWQKNDGTAVGDTSLLYSEDRYISRKYKHLLFLGDTINPTAYTLVKKEHSINFVNTFYHYGLTNYWMLGTSVAGNFIGAFNLESKLRLHDSKNFTVSLGASGTQTKDTQVGSVSAYLAVPSNGRFIAHSSVDIRLARNRANRYDSIQALRGSLNLESNVKTATEYILGNWHRIVFGPQYYFNPKSIGGFWAYHFVWNRFELAAGIRTRNFIEIKKTAALFNFSWRL